MISPRRRGVNAISDLRIVAAKQFTCCRNRDFRRDVFIAIPAQEMAESSNRERRHCPGGNYDWYVGQNARFARSARRSPR